MAMTLPIIIPATPSAGHSPASDDSSNAPRTPVSPNTQAMSLSEQSAANSASTTQMKRKPSRRANTAERRATHNAVERQRRETLNGRFLDLAALLPNLSQIRRPSKSSIVNSSIAHVHASRRHRLLAARELRLIKLESDALRRELNEWRDRAGLPRVEEPVRGDGFTMVLSGELEVIAAVPGDEEDDEGAQGGYNVYDEDNEEYGSANMAMENLDDRNAMSMLKNANANPFAHNLPAANNLAHILPRPSQGPMVATSPSAVSFENPAMASLYEPHTHQSNQYPGAHFIQQQQQSVQVDAEKWNAQLYSALSTGHQQHHMLQAQRTLFTPPSTSHGMSTPPSSSSSNSAPNPFTDPASHAFFVNFQRQQLAAMQQQQMNGGQIYGSPDRDDSSSVDSGRGRRERSSSLSNSGYDSPQHSGNYEIPTVLPSGHGSAGDYGLPRGITTGLHVNTNAAASWAREAEMGGMAILKQNHSSPISVGGGGNGSGYAMMM